MELEFDKEIDVLLRKARDDRGVLVGDDPPVPKKHLDADVIAAFAENAIPESSKRLCVEHFADCDICRRTLSQTILMNAEADQAAASAVSPAPIAAAAAPWYERIFRLPNLALAMGALVLAFSGILGFLVIERSGNTVDLAKATDQEQRPGGGPSALSEPSTTVERQDSGMANSAAPAANKSADAKTQTPGNMPSSSASAASSNTAVSTVPTSGRELPLSGRNMKEFTLDGAETSGAGKPAAAAPAPVTAGETIASRDEKANDDKLKDSNADVALSKTEEKKADRDDAPKVAAKRAAGPMNANQTQQQSNVVAMGTFENTARKQAGGKSFSQRNAVWYDNAYHGQPTQNYKRGTDEYKKLDSGLRSIAETIGGTVVVVWKEKAYRIQ